MDDEEVLCLFNSHGGKSRCADVLVDCDLNRTDGNGALTAVFNSAHEAARPKRFSGAYRKGSKQKVKKCYGNSPCRDQGTCTILGAGAVIEL